MFFLAVFKTCIQIENLKKDPMYIEIMNFSIHFSMLLITFSGSSAKNILSYYQKQNKHQ